MVTIQQVRQGKELQDFIRVPFDIYKNDTNWIAPLMLERKRHLGSDNPYFDHARAAYFLARDGKGRAVGRISAQLDELAQEQASPEREGHFGLMEAHDAQTLSRLLDAAQHWLREQGATLMRGPYSLSINDEAGLLVDGFDASPYMLMNYAPSWYGDVLENAGFTKAKDLLGYKLDLARDMPAAITRRSARMRANGEVTERPLNRARLGRELETVLGIFNDAWAGNWGFVPMTEEEIRTATKDLKPLIHPDLVRIAEIDGQAAGMIVALPDLNTALAGMNGHLFPLNWARLIWRLKIKGVDKARVLLMGIAAPWRDTARGAALSAILIERLHTALNRNGFQEAELSWLLEDNSAIIRLVESTGAQCDKRYRIFEKGLE